MPADLPQPGVRENCYFAPRVRLWEREEWRQKRAASGKWADIEKRGIRDYYLILQVYEGGKNEIMLSRNHMLYINYIKRNNFSA